MQSAMPPTKKFSKPAGAVGFKSKSPPIREKKTNLIDRTPPAETHKQRLAKRGMKKGKITTSYILDLSKDRIAEEKKQSALKGPEMIKHKKFSKTA